jgi:regulator of cell morphogenesis and NO signaling
MENTATLTVRDIALAAPATTRVFEEFHIDYCCGGRKSVADACAAAGVDADVVQQRLDDLIGTPDANARFQPENATPSELIGYILATHHVFTVEETARLTALMAKVVRKHGELHPELLELRDVFSHLVDSLIPHMRKEENVLFPYIQQMEAAVKHGSAPPLPHFGTVENPVRMMTRDHESDGLRLAKIRQITNHFTPPEGACPSFTALYAGLEDLEKDLHRHIHLENNVLFPAAIQLETHC